LPQVSVRPATIFGVVCSVKSVRPGSTRSGEKARWKSSPARRPDSSRIGRQRSRGDAGGRLEAAGDGLQLARRDVLDVGLAPAQLRHATGVDLDADDLLAGLGEAHGQWEPHVAQSNDPNAHVHPTLRDGHVAGLCFLHLRRRPDEGAYSPSGEV
jgi:hypothetical protein